MKTAFLISIPPLATPTQLCATMVMLLLYMANPVLVMSQQAVSNGPSARPEITVISPQEKPVPTQDAEVGPQVPTVGMEGRLELTLPGPALDAKPVDIRSKVLVRVASTRPHGTLIYYDLRYVGLEPGKFDLRDYLIRKDGSTVTNLAPIPVEIAGLLPPRHNGFLSPQPVEPFPMLGGYKVFIIGVAVVWLLLFIPLWRMGRHKSKAVIVSGPAPALTLADRLQPLVEQAAQGTLSRDGQAQLERLLLTHWRERLGLAESSLLDSITRLREHPEAGALLRALEGWLHRPPGAEKVDVAALLAPYRERRN
ncbi:MAG: hypothetical protein AB1813_20210 [Verrucomicrobiota bacterium]|jgi:hypothetical protein